MLSQDKKEGLNMATIATVLQSIVGAIIASLAIYDLLISSKREVTTHRIAWATYDILMMTFGVFLMAW